MKNRIWLIIATAVITLLSGCQTTNQYYLGAHAKPANVKEIPDQSVAEQRWEDLYLTIGYTMKQQQKTLEISGYLTFSLHPKLVYQRVYDMDVTFFILDSDNRVLSYRDVGPILSNDLDAKTEFKEIFTLPEGAAAVTFGYEGTFIDEDHQSFRVWELPSRN